MVTLLEKLRQAGGGLVTPQETVLPGRQAVTSLTPEQQAALLGKPTTDPLIVPYGGAVSKTKQTFGTADDKYAQALGKERLRIDNEKRAYKEQQTTARATLAAQVAAAEQAYLKALDADKQNTILMRGVTALNHKVDDTGTSPWQPDARFAAQDSDAAKQAAASLGTLNQQLHDFDTNYDSNMEKYFAPMEKNYTDAVTLATGIRDYTKQQGGYDADYAKASAAYDSAVTQHDKDRAAYDMYVAQKGQYDQDTANRQADLEAGRYAVNPYLFMAQGASLPEINALRDQVNSGNLRPNMRVPDAETAPTEVTDPGAFVDDKPVHAQAAAPVPASADAAKILNWTAPAAAAPDAALPEVSTTKTDVSSVTPGYTQPAVNPDKVAPKTDTTNTTATSPNGTTTNTGTNTPAPATNTLQTTAQNASNTSTQTTPAQTAATAAAPAAALPEQTSGTVTGQSNSTGQAPNSTPAVKPEDKPEPFTPKADEKDDDANVWQG